MVIRDGKDRKDRVIMLPSAVKEVLAAHIERVSAQHQADLRHGAGWVEVPGATRAANGMAVDLTQPPSFYVDRVTGQRHCHHLHESVLQRAVCDAVRAAGIGVQSRWR
jgi:hypothetical protein